MKENVTGVNIDDYLETVPREISSIIKSVGDIGTIISNYMRNLHINNDQTESFDNYNIHGETQTPLDVYANMLFRDRLMKINCIKAIVSEEEDDITVINGDKTYIVAYDPIDGSSNIDLNIPVGSIFGIYETNNKIVSSGYIIYGSATVYVFVINNSVAMFVLNNKNQWILTRTNIKIPVEGINYSINEGNQKYWTGETKKYIKQLKSIGKCSLRYVGSMVADIHRTLLVGGIFIYPNDIKNPDGKLRQLYEVNPMSHIIEVAGGVSYTGQDKIRCLDIPIVDIHQKCPIFIGSVSNVNQAINIMSC